MIDYSKDLKYIALYNTSDKATNLEFDLSCVDMNGSFVFDCWDGTFLGAMDRINVSAPPRSAYMFMVKRAPDQPSFLFSDGEAFLGQGGHVSTYENGELIVTSTRDTDENIYVFYPAGITPKGRICFKNKDTLGGVIAVYE